MDPNLTRIHTKQESLPPTTLTPEVVHPTPSNSYVALNTLKVLKNDPSPQPPLILSLDDTSKAQSPNALSKAVKRVAKKPSKAQKRKKNQCYFDTCISTISEFIGDCEFCDGHFCSRHRLLETHRCEGLHSFREELRKRNAEKLALEKTGIPKIQI